MLTHHGMIATQALDEATRMTNTALRRFIRLRDEIPDMLDALRLNPSERHAVGESVAGMENWIRGNHDWARTTGRYRPTDAAARPEDVLSPPTPPTPPG